MIPWLLCALVWVADVPTLAKQLKSSEERERRAAVQALAKDGSKEALALLVGALRDAEAMVADEAQIALANCQDAAVFTQLMGKDGLGASDERVALRALEIARSAPEASDVGAIPKLLTDKRVELRRSACTTVEQLAQAARFSAKDREVAQGALLQLCTREKDPELRARAVLAQRAFQESLDPALFQLCARANDPWMLSASLELLQGAQDAAAWSHRELLAKHAARGVRLAVVRELASQPTRESVDLLVRMIAAEKDLRLSWSVAAALESHTGMRNGVQVGAWTSWWEANRDSWTPEKKRPLPARKAEEYEGTAVFAGLPLISDRIAILFDMSGSMWEKRADGKTRKQNVEQELERTLKALPSHARFNLIPYTRQPLPWEKALVPASPANVQRGLEWFRGLKDSGQGNVWDALLLALADPEVDTILLFSDGAPSGGPRWNVKLIADGFAERNRLRGVAVDHVLVGAPKALRATWKRLSESSGGRLLEIEMN